MAINPNTKHENNHCMVSACTGGGKSQLIGQQLIPKGAGHRVLLWDPDEDYKATRFFDRAKYARAVAAALKSGRGFRLAYSGNPTVDNFRWWCSVVWAALDGSKTTHIIIEELADVSPSAGKALPEFGEVLRKGRKYGARLVMATQRGAEIPKTAWRGVRHRYIGQQEMADRQQLAKEAGISAEAIAALQPLQFWHKQSGAADPTKVIIKYRKIN